MASTCSTFCSTCNSFKAPTLPIDTWSSCPRLVGIESTDAGWLSTLFSETRAAAVYCGIINPELMPVSRINSVGKPSRSEEHTSELQSRGHLVCRLLLEK